MKRGRQSRSGVESTKTRSGKGIPEEWLSPPGRFRSPWDYDEHLKIHDAQENSETLHKEPMAKRMERFFPRLAARRLSLTHAEAGRLDTPGAIATLLLFYDTLLLEICPLCLTSDTIPTASALLERGLVVPQLVTDYSSFKGGSLDLIQTHQEAIVSHYAKQAYVHVSLVGTSFKQYRRESSEFSKRLEAADRNAQRLGSGYAQAVKAATFELEATPSPFMKSIADRLEEAIANRNLREISACALRADAVNTLEVDQAYSNVPNFEVEEYHRLEPVMKEFFHDLKPTFQETVDLCAKGLQIAWTPDMPIEDYLDIVATYRPKLGGLFLASSDPAKAIASATTIVSEINAELEEISRSRRYRWGVFGLNLLRLPSMIGLLSRVGLGGVHGLDAVISNLASSRPQRRKDPVTRDFPLHPSLAEKLLARYFGHSLSMVQLWSLQKAIAKSKRQLTFERIRRRQESA